MATEGNYFSPVVAKFLKASEPRKVLQDIMHEFTGKSSQMLRITVEGNMGVLV